MADSKHRLTDADVQRLLAGNVSRAEAERIRAALRASPEARARYDRWVRAERALEGRVDDGGLSAAAKARVSERLFASMPAEAERRSWGWPILIVATTAAIAGVMVLPMRDAASPVEEFRHRGQKVFVSSDRVLQVLQVSLGVDGGVQIKPADRLAPSDRLRFAVFVRDGDCRVSVVAVGADERRHVLLERAVVRRRASAQRLDVATTVPQDWRGPVKFVGVFEDAATGDLMRMNLDARDEPGLSVRVVRTTVGGSR